ncbi:unnamed protein product, partial [Callosobruchus maculatus]
MAGMGSKDPEQWLRWYDEVMLEESMNENAEIIYAEEDSDSEVDEVQESDHDSDTEQEDDSLPQNNVG